MYRKIMGFLEAWKDREHRKPLILQGARQVGKTYSILEFGRTHYENVAYFNFETVTFILGKKPALRQRSRKLARPFPSSPIPIKQSFLS